jgi:hypothetical protein
MNSRMKQLSVSAFMAGTLLLSTSLQAQTGTSGENGKTANFDPQPIAVYSVMPPCAPKTTVLAAMPVPVANGNKPEELKTFTEDATKWAAENPEAFNSLDQATKDLFNTGNFEALMNKVKDLQQNTKK